jgi:hypothetical protein
MSFKFNLYEERDKKDKLQFGVIKLHQLELFGLVNCSGSQTSKMIFWSKMDFSR